MPPAWPDHSTLDREPPLGLSDRDVDRWFHALAELDAIHYRADRPPAAPHFPPRLAAHRQDPKGQGPMKTFEYDLGSWAAPTDSDVVARRVAVTLDGADQAPVDIPLDQPIYTLKGVRVGQKVKASYAFVDDAGNVSELSPALEFTCVDDVAPMVPSGDGLQVVAHRQVDDGAGPAPTP